MKLLMRSSSSILQKLRNYNALSPQQLGSRAFASPSLSGERLTAPAYGEPVDVLKVESYKVEDVQDDQTIVQMLAAPVNPVDINMIQGVYGIKPPLPTLPGMEGVGVVHKLGSGSNPFNLTEGEWVIPRRFDFAGGGCWQKYLVGSNADYLPIPKMSLEAAATISVNPPTAFRMLKDFETLTSGDIVIQNGGNSGVGQAVIQLCREFGLKSISIVRNRDSIHQLKDYLTKLGRGSATIFTEEEFREESKKGRIPTAKLALNCVGGKSAIDIARPLAPGGTMVTYGGMSRQPIIISTAQLIFNDIKAVGFGISRWNELVSVEERLEMLYYIAQLCVDGKFVPPETKIVPLANYKEAFVNSPLEGFVGKKYILSFQ